MVFFFLMLLISYLSVLPPSRILQSFLQCLSWLNLLSNFGHKKSRKSVSGFPARCFLLTAPVCIAALSVYLKILHDSMN